MRTFIGTWLAFLLALVPELASAQQVVRAADGQSIDGQSARTRQAFVGMYGQGCAAQEWAWQHSVSVDNSLLDNPTANDGQNLSAQDDDVQIVFVAVWGVTAAASEWVAEHNAVIGRHVLPAPVGPIPCPAIRVVSASAIDPAHLRDAVSAAMNGNLPEAHANLNQFRDLWNTTKADIRKRSPTLADAVQAAYDQAAAVISDPKRPTPAVAEYLLVLQNLLKVVLAANDAVAR